MRRRPPGRACRLNISTPSPSACLGAAWRRLAKGWRKAAGAFRGRPRELRVDISGDGTDSNLECALASSLYISLVLDCRAYPCGGLLAPALASGFFLAP